MKRLYFDIETTPNLTYTWGIGKQYVGHDSIAKERKVSIISYMWEHDLKMHRLSFDLSKHDLSKYDDDADKEILTKFCEVYKTAQETVAHNGVKFDLGMIRSRLVKYGLPNIAPIIITDTYLNAKHIRFNCHKLDYLGKYLGVGQKLDSKLADWIGIMNSSKAALKRQGLYCDGDVRLLYKVCQKLRPYILTKVPHESVHDLNCPHCGSKKIHVHGYKVSAAGKKRQYQCQDCGRYCLSKTIESPNLLRPI